MKFLFLLWIVFAVGLGTGWVKNIVKFTKCDFEAPYKTEVLRGVGIIPPIGAVIGWMTFDEEKKGF
jgi:hypothetical protein